MSFPSTFAILSSNVHACAGQIKTTRNLEMQCRYPDLHIRGALTLFQNLKYQGLYIKFCVVDAHYNRLV